MEPGGDLFSARATRLDRGNGAGRLAISVPRLRLFFGGRISPELSSMDRPVVVRPNNDFANTCPLLARCDFDIPFPLSGSSNPTDQHVARKLGNIRSTKALKPYLVVKFKILKLSHRIFFYMHEVLNLDEIKNKLHSLFINYETNLMSLTRLLLDTKLLQ